MDDINPDTKLSDAVFNIIDAKGQVVRTNLTTDKDGKVSASNLRPRLSIRGNESSERL